MGSSRQNHAEEASEITSCVPRRAVQQGRISGARCLGFGVWFEALKFLPAGVFGGRQRRQYRRPSLHRSKTFNGPLRSNPSRRHQSSGEIVRRFSVKVMVVVFIVIIHYLKTPLVNDFAGFRLCHFMQCLHKTGGLSRQTLKWQMKNEKQRRATVPVLLASHPGADNPDKTATEIISGSFFIATDRVRGKSGTHFQDDFIDPARRDVQRPRQRVLRQATRQHKFFPQNFPRMNGRQFVRRAFHGFTFNFSAVASLRWLVLKVRNSRAPRCNAVATCSTSKLRCPPVMVCRLEIVSASR